ncbi:MAG: anaerobic ribonucleoside-triphosphate reductase activating protein [Lentisphaeria bacterium]|nr:anaerobic ribonucleoside-triphosphate reductase activating protein [Lentisphaeria bacterium]
MKNLKNAEPSLHGDAVPTEQPERATDPPELDIRGLTPFTTLDYPGKLACVLFCAGCNLRCGYCQNPALVLDPESQPRIREEEVLAFLRQRRGKLDAVVISGGEPTIHVRLPAFMVAVKALGFLVRLDTNGTNPKMIRACHQAGVLDSLGIDYKAPAARYHEVSASTSLPVWRNVNESISFAVNQRIDLDIRTTVHCAILPPEDLRLMREELDSLGVRQWFLQQFHAVETIDETLHDTPTYSDEELLEIAVALPNTEVRGIA